jgi:hypothetical protein
MIGVSLGVLFLIIIAAILLCLLGFSVLAAHIIKYTR